MGVSVGQLETGANRDSCVYNVPKSKLLPVDFPPVYLLTLGWNGRGGGKSEGKVCAPTFGGGSGTTT
jgi:hypothetical protein